MMVAEPSFDPYEGVLEELDIKAPVAKAEASDSVGSSAFVIPQQVTIIHARCPACRGNAYAEYGEIHCMMCNRHLYVAAVSERGRVIKLALFQVVARLSRAG